MKWPVPVTIAVCLLWTACAKAPTVVPDVPSTIGDLEAQQSAGGVITLTWTAPGGQESTGPSQRYDLRRSTPPLTETTWDAAEPIACPLKPKRLGEAERFVVSDLPHGTWEFGLRSVNASNEWSGLSNTATVTLSDPPPAQVADLAVSGTTATTVTATWTAPGEDAGRGRATAYDVRYGIDDLAEATWDAAVRVNGVPPPDSAGRRETLTITGLEADRSYFIGLKTMDAAGQWSALSNVVSAALVRMRRLTTLPPIGASRPSWSPDSRYIAYGTNDLHGGQIYMIEPNGGDPTQLTNHSYMASDPAWSHDGQRLAFTLRRHDQQDSYMDLCVMDAVPFAPATTLVLGQGSVHNLLHPTWSPDDTRIAYEHGRFHAFQAPDSSTIEVVSVAGGTPTALTEDWNERRPDWSPDGSRIAYSAGQRGSEDIWVMPATGGDGRKLTDDSGSDVWPAWSPDGTKIAFSSNRGGTYDIWVMPADGGTLTQLTDDPGSETQPAWAPDGSAIAFILNPGGQGSASDVWVLYLR